MRYALIPLACLAILPAACGKMPGELREYVLQDGDWGWGNGAGCKDRTDVWDIAGDRITIYSQGEIAGYLRLDERRGLYSNGLTSGSGAWTDMLWILHGPAPDRQRRDRTPGDASCDPGRAGAHDRPADL